MRRPADFSSLRRRGRTRHPARSRYDNGTFLSFLTLAEGARGAYLPLSLKH